MWGSHLGDRGSHISDRGSSMWAFICCFPGELAQKWSSWNLNWLSIISF